MFNFKFTESFIDKNTYNSNFTSFANCQLFLNGLYLLENQKLFGKKYKLGEHGRADLLVQDGRVVRLLLLVPLQRAARRVAARAAAQAERRRAARLLRRLATQPALPHQRLLLAARRALPAARVCLPARAGPRKPQRLRCAQGARAPQTQEGG